MKILYLNHNFKGEGTYFRAFNFAKGLALLGHDVSLFTMSPKKNFMTSSYMESGVRITEFPKLLDIGAGGWAPLDLICRMLICAVKKYDLVHAFAHKPTVYLPALLAKKLHKSTVLFSDWDDWWGRGGINKGGRMKLKTKTEDFLEEDIIKKADYVTATSVALKTRALGLNVPQKRLFHIPSGCDINRIRPLQKKQIVSLKKKFSIDPKAGIMEFIGFGQADLGIVIDGFIQAKSRIKNLVLLIVGPLEKKWEQKISDSCFKSDIIVTGKVPYDLVPEYAAMADICYLPLSDTPANRGRGPIKAGDYMAAGKPIIANPVGDISEWIKKYRVGITADYSGKSIAEKTVFLFKNPGLMKKLGINSRRTAENVLSWDKVSQKMAEAYKHAVSFKNK